MYGILFVLSVLAAGYGTLMLTEATQGVGFIGLAAVLGIYARLAQADMNHEKLKAQLRALADSGEEDDG